MRAWRKSERFRRETRLNGQASEMLWRMENVESQAKPYDVSLEQLRARRRELQSEIQQLSRMVRQLEGTDEPGGLRELVAGYVREVLHEQGSASSSDLVRAVLSRDDQLHAGSARAIISTLRRDGQLRLVSGRGIPGDPLVLGLPLDASDQGNGVDEPDTSAGNDQ